MTGYPRALRAGPMVFLPMKHAVENNEDAWAASRKPGIAQHQRGGFVDHLLDAWKGLIGLIRIYPFG